MQGNILQCYPVMLPSDVIPRNVTLWRHLPRADRAAHSSVKLSATKKHRLFQNSIEPGHSETYKSLSEDSLICNSTQVDQRFWFPHE